MQAAYFNTIMSTLTQLVLMYLGYLGVIKAIDDYFKTRVAEADRKSQAKMLEFIVKEIDVLKDCQQKGVYSEHEIRKLLDTLTEDFRFIRDQIIKNAFPKTNSKEDLK